MIRLAQDIGPCSDVHIQSLVAQSKTAEICQCSQQLHSSTNQQCLPYSDILGTLALAFQDEMNEGGWISQAHVPY